MISIVPLGGIGEVAPGADLSAILRDAMSRADCTPREGDVLAVTQKIVSKAEGRFRNLRDIEPGARAREMAVVAKKDPRLVELILRESSEIVRLAPNVIVARHRLGLVMANAGIDRSNIGPGTEERVLLLPENPDASAAALAKALGVSVIITDSFGRPWRMGVVNIAIGAAGVTALIDKRGRPDRDGRPLEVTQIALADAIAAAAGLVIGEAGESVPAALIRGLDFAGETPSPASALLRPLAEDLFR